MKYWLASYERDGEGLVQECLIPEASVNEILKAFGVLPGESLGGMLCVDERHAAVLSRVCGMPLDLNRYDYFVEEYADDAEGNA